MGCALMVVVVLVLWSAELVGQVYVSDTLRIHVYSDELVEDIDAVTTTGVCVFRSADRRVYCRVPSASLTFRNSLMGRHYRDNYMEVHRYPYIVFSGVVQDSLPLVMRSGWGDSVWVEGEFTIHGTTKKELLPAYMEGVGTDTFTVRSVFWLVPAEYGIRQPVRLGIRAADSVRVSVFVRMCPKSQD